MTLPERRRWYRNPLFGTFLGALLLLLVVTGWLLTDKNTSRSDALKTGGLAGGALVALYALWLNDRRRQVEERRQAVERNRYELESTRIADERFAKSVELLGNPADQVRVGAMHALAGLARNRPGYTQTVLDVLCAYLRRPFDHPRFHEEGATGTPEVEQELTVRLTAQRLVGNLLQDKESPESVGYDLDLTGATLEYFKIESCRIGTLTIRQAKLLGTTTFRNCDIKGHAWFTEATTGVGRLAGHFHCDGTVFHRRAWFSGVRFGSLADFDGAHFLGEATFKNTEFEGHAILRDTRFSSSLELKNAHFTDYADLRIAEMPSSVALYNTLVNPARENDLPDGWATESATNGRTRLTIPRS